MGRCSLCRFSCARCKLRKYCSKEHQVAHWKAHAVAHWKAHQRECTEEKKNESAPNLERSERGLNDSMASSSFTAPHADPPPPPPPFPASASSDSEGEKSACQDQGQVPIYEYRMVRTIIGYAHQDRGKVPGAGGGAPTQTAQTNNPQPQQHHASTNQFPQQNDQHVQSPPQPQQQGPQVANIPPKNASPSQAPAPVQLQPAPPLYPQDGRYSLQVLQLQQQQMQKQDQQKQQILQLHTQRSKQQQQLTTAQAFKFRRHKRQQQRQPVQQLQQQIQHGQQQKMYPPPREITQMQQQQKMYAPPPAMPTSAPTTTHAPEFVLQPADLKPRRAHFNPPVRPIKKEHTPPTRQQYNDENAMDTQEHNNSSSSFRCPAQNCHKVFKNTIELGKHVPVHSSAPPMEEEEHQVKEEVMKQQQAQHHFQPQKVDSPPTATMMVPQQTNRRVGAPLKPVYARKHQTNDEWVEYPSMNEAARKLNLDQGNISAVTRGKRKQTGGWGFKLKQQHQHQHQQQQQQQQSPMIDRPKKRLRRAIVRRNECPRF